MSIKMKTEELKTLIANYIREEDLHESLPEDAVEKIKQRIMSKNNKDSAEEIPNVVSELDIPTINTNTTGREFPDAREGIPSAEDQLNISGDTAPEVFVDPGSVPTETPIEPTMGYTPELPEMLKKASPGELFVFDYNDIGESGENLSFKPMRTMNDPDIKKSMQDLWIQEGKTKADVYVAKFEKIGEIDFNYTDGTSRFNETPSLPDYAGGPKYKDNPYAAESTPQIDEPTKNELETYIKSSVDLDKVVHDIVMNIVKDSLLTNTERAENDDTNIQEDIYDYGENRENNGYNVAQAVKPMEEGFTLTMRELIDSEEYEKITLPEELNEAIKSGDNSLLISENEDMQKWEFEGKEYYTQINRLSKTKGYIKS